VLARQVGAPAGTAPYDRDAAGLAAERRRLEDRDLEPTLRQLVGGGQAGHAASQDDDAAARRTSEGRSGAAPGQQGGCPDGRTTTEQCAPVDGWRTSGAVRGPHDGSSTVLRRVHGADECQR
jgi:hypothetical protein